MDLTVPEQPACVRWSQYGACMRISIDLDDLTFGELYNFVDLARNANVGPEEHVIVETEDNIGNEVGAHTLAADLGAAPVDPPVILQRNDVIRYVDALSRELAQESDKGDLEVLNHLLDDLTHSAM